MLPLGMIRRSGIELIREEDLTCDAETPGNRRAQLVQQRDLHLNDRKAEIHALSRAARQTDQPGQNRRHRQVDPDQDEVPVRLTRVSRTPALGEANPWIAIPRKTKE